jgi:hypothetical protein
LAISRSAHSGSRLAHLALRFVLQALGDRVDFRLNLVGDLVAHVRLGLLADLGGDGGGGIGSTRAWPVERGITKR